MNINTQEAFNLMLSCIAVAAPIALVWGVLSRALRGFVDMVTGRDTIRL